MAEILLAAQAIVAAPPAASRSEATQAGQPPKPGAEAEAPASFAAVLKSCNDKAAGGATQQPAETDALPEAADPAAIAGVVPLIDPAALLARLESAPTAAPTEDSALLAAGELPVAANAGGLPIPLPQPLQGWPATGGGLAPGQMPQASLARSADDADSDVEAPAPAPSLTPTTAPVPGRVAVSAVEGNRSTQRDTPFAGADGERRAAADKLAVKAAITADPGRTGPLPVSQSETGAEFRAAMERLSNPLPPSAMQTTVSAPPAQAPVVRVETPLGQPGWGREVGETLTWMASSNKQQADLVLNPPQLGRIEVSMVVEGDQLSASFASANAAVRETLENSLPRLREILAEAGITLGDTHVGAESRHEARFSNARAQHAAANAGRDSGFVPQDGLGAGSPWHSGAGRGMVDVFA